MCGRLVLTLHAQEKGEAERRANEAEVALLNVVESLKENERKQKDRYDSAIASTTKKAEAAVERANKMEEKLGKLLEMMKGKCTARPTLSF